MNLTLVSGSAAVVLAVVALIWAFTGARHRRSAVDLAVYSRTSTPDLRRAMLDQGVGDRVMQPFVAGLGRFAGRYTPGSRRAAIEHRLLLAGSPNGWTVERVLAVKTLAAVLGLGLGAIRMATQPSALALTATVLFAVTGFFAPDILLRRRAEQRQEEVRREIADTIDQLTVAVQAGLGLDAAIGRVARSADGPLAAELTRVVQDTRAGMRRTDALLAMSDRVRLPELRQVVVALAQAEKLGVPVSQTLQVQAAQLRLKRRQHAEEQAMKLPVKILFPMVLCILPCLFIVILGPAAIDIYNNLVGM